MSDDNKYPSDEFDENFDDLDFDDTDLSDDAGLYDDIPEDELEADFEGESFEDEWDESDDGEEQSGRKGKKAKSLYTDTERKGFSLSFNTMVIIGAVLLGGSVMAYTVMTKTAKVNAGKGETFRSSLNISSVLDGTIFGSKDEKTENPDAGQDPSAQSSDGTGFLDNPEGVAVLDENQPIDMGANPPMPSPITPMPDEDVEQVPVIGDADNIDGPVPRGPDETPSEMSAQDILNQMKAARENRIQEEAAPDAEQPQPEEIASEPVITDNAQDTVPEIAAALPSDTSAEEKLKLEEANRKAAEAQSQVQSLQGTINSLQSQVQNLEGELESLRGSQTRESSGLEQTVAKLESDLKAAQEAAARAEKSSKEEANRAAKAAADAKTAKDRAAKAEEAAKKAESQKAVVSKDVAKAPAPAPAPRKAASTPKPVVSATSSSAAQWELRAAQPGRAWVSKPGARDMQGVTVGETLPGVGRITGISYVNGRWVVQGTQGQILQ